MKITCRFHPQAWINDYAVECDPEGETEWVMNWPDDQPLPEADTYESDRLRLSDAAPAWVQEWHGPFYVEIVS